MSKNCAMKELYNHEPLPTGKAETMKTQIGCYYFPNYHTGDPRNAAFHGKDWSEWLPVRNAIPRFPGHRQPRIPLWGETDEKDPQVMAQKIDAAANAGIGVFIFDWYYYDDGPFLNAALEKGFMHAQNRSRMKFCNMWANHDWYDIHPASRTKCKLLYPGKFARATFEKVAELHIQHYFSSPEYFLIDGCPYFSIYELERLVQSFGSLQETRRAFADFRTAVKAAGFPDLHFNAIIWGQPILPGESIPQDPAHFAEELGADSAASYVWVHHVNLPLPQSSYTNMRKQYFDFWHKTQRECRLEYFPNVSVGWDTTPRTRPEEQCNCNEIYPYGPVVVGNTPEEFKKSLEMMRDELAKLCPEHPFFTINSWNEWTEGSYLEPDTFYGFAYLDAIRSVFP